MVLQLIIKPFLHYTFLAPFIAALVVCIILIILIFTIDYGDEKWKKVAVWVCAFLIPMGVYSMTRIGLCEHTTTKNALQCAAQKIIKKGSKTVNKYSPTPLNIYKGLSSMVPLQKKYTTTSTDEYKKGLVVQEARESREQAKRDFVIDRDNKLQFQQSLNKQTGSQNLPFI